MDYLLILTAFVAVLAVDCWLSDRRATRHEPPSPRTAVGLTDAVLHPHSYLLEQEARECR